MSEDAVVAAASEAIRKGSKSFAAASRLFDRRTRESAVMLYAWCRHCDDVVDGQELGRGSRGPIGDAGERLAELEDSTRAALDGGRVDGPAFAGLRAVARRHDLPARYPLQHLAGFRMDVQGRRYETLADTLDYAYRVAGVVGVMMSHVMGARDRETLRRASDLGIAFQLTNMARDVVEDARAGRVYLPARWLAEAGVPDDGVADPAARERLAGAVARLLDAAEPYYASARLGLPDLPPRAAWAIATARGVYRQIGVDVRRLGPRAWDRRVSTSRWSKLGHVAQGAALAGLSRLPSVRLERGGLYEPPL